MKSKKIVICEDDWLMGELLISVIKEIGYYPIKMPYYVDKILETLEEVLIKEEPDYVIIDGLNGHWDKIGELIKKTRCETIPVIYTGDQIYIQNARKKGYTTFEKGGETQELLAFLKEEYSKA